MKKLILFIIFLTATGRFSTAQNLPCNVLPQQFADWCYTYVWLDTLDVAADSQLIVIDTAGGCNTWQLGPSYKPVFDSVSSPFGLVTDTLLPYKMGVKCSFIVKQELASSFNPTLLFFEHKYKADSLLDGGYIEFSCDHGQNWQLVNDEQWQQDPGPTIINYYNYAGLPSGPASTLHDTVPAFTGTNGEWQWSGIQLVWAIPLMQNHGSRGPECWDMDSLYYRFTFESDSVDNAKAGWMIRNIVVGFNDIGGAVAEISSQPLKIYPNPANDKISIELPPGAGKFINITISDIAGNMLTTPTTRPSSSVPVIDVSSLSSGIYFVLVETDKFVFRQKMIKQ